MIETSVIIVSYQAQKELENCLASIPKHKTIEVIIIDNNQENRGFAKAVNLGARQAKGKYLFFLNPDCEVFDRTISQLVECLQKNDQIGIVGPQLLDNQRKAYQSYTRQPTRLSSLVVYSIINKWWPHNPISRDYWYQGQSPDLVREVESLSGAAMMVRRREFLEMGGFDDNLIMYWEDFDLSRRYLKLGMKLLYEPAAKVIHLGRRSTGTENERAQRWFRQARYRFFRKYFGNISAVTITGWLTLLEEWQFTLILIIAIVLRFWRLPELMPFIGDQARDFIVAKQALLHQQIPLLGIESSVPRFSQGPLYLWLIMALLSFNLRDPIWAGIVAALTGIMIILFGYYLVKWSLNKDTATITALILATSPLVVAQARLPFMSNPIPLVSLLYLWRLYLPYRRLRDWFLVTLAFALVFQFELATFPLIILALGYLYKWRNRFSSKLKMAGVGLMGLVIGLAPQVIFDLTHQFKQLGLFGVWVAYRIVAYLGFDREHVVSTATLNTFSQHMGQYLSRFYAWGQPPATYLMLAILIWGGSLYIYGRFKGVRNRMLTIMWAWLGILTVGYMIHSAPSEAYFPIMFVPLASLSGYYLSQIKVKGYKLGIYLAWGLALINIYFIFNHDFMMSTLKNIQSSEAFPYGIPLATQKQVVDEIYQENPDRRLVITYIGEAGDIPHFMDGLIYLSSLKGLKLDPLGQEVSVTFDPKEVNYLSKFGKVKQAGGIYWTQPQLCY